MIRCRQLANPSAFLSLLVLSASIFVAGISFGCASSGTTGGVGAESGRSRSFFGLGKRGAPWTIQCLELPGPDRVQAGERIAATLRATPGIRPDDVLIRHGSDGVVRIYYGKYFRRQYSKAGDRRLPSDMRADLDLIHQLADASGRRFFLTALPVRMPTPDVGDPAWALGNVGATYTLQVAVFEPTGDFWQFKKAAADYCARLRSLGYDAYYYHTDSSSLVTVGAFGPDAVITDANGRTHYSSEVQAVQRDEWLRYNRLNGAVYKAKSDTGEYVRVPSRLVMVPKRAGTAP